MPRKAAASAQDLRPTAAVSASGTGGRLTVDTPFDLFGTPDTFVSPRTMGDLSQLLSLDEEVLHRTSQSQLMELLAEFSPEMSRALWDFLRFCNPGYTITCTKPGGTTPQKQAQAMVEAFFDQLTDYHGSPDVVIGRLFMAAFLRGTIVAELVLDLDGRAMVDLATPDPASIRYKREMDPVRGPIYIPVQWQNRQVPVPGTLAGYIPLTWPTIRVVPIDPFPGTPYGRAMAAPALFPSLFLLGLLHDLRRVITQQGYPRLDVELDEEKVLATMPSTIKTDPAKMKKWMNDTIAEVQKVYSNLKPDDTYIHWSVSKVNRPVGAISADALGAVDGIIEALERMSTRALKTMPFLMASNQSSSESQAIREWEVQTQGVRSIQHYVETMVSRLLELGLQAQGQAASVAFRFAELRASEEIRDATVDSMKINNASNQYSWGWISQDEAAKLGADKGKADADAPRILPRGASETTDAAAPQVAPELEGGSGDTPAAASDAKEKNNTKSRTAPLRVVGED